MVKHVLIVLLAGSLWSAVLAQAQESALAGSDESSGKEALQRASAVTSYRQRGQWLAQHEQVSWFGEAEQFWLVTLAAKADPVGDVLLISDREPQGGSHLARLRLDLSRMGWRTHYLLVPPQDNKSVVTQAAQTLQRSNRLFVICEGSVCLEQVSSIQTLPATGLVFVNMPVTGTMNITPVAVRERLQVFAGLSRASLVLQERPNGWPVQQPLAPDVELHLLPRSNPAVSNSQIMRKFRGWLKRRHQLG